jgi:hypothetical protein
MERKHVLQKEEGEDENGRKRVLYGMQTAWMTEEATDKLDEECVGKVYIWPREKE